MDDSEILKKLVEIQRILLLSPEIYAATFITMWEEWQEAQRYGRSAKDLWELIPPILPKTRSHDGADSPASAPGSHAADDSHQRGEKRMRKRRLLQWMMEHEMIVTIIVSVIASFLTTLLSMAIG